MRNHALRASLALIVTLVIGSAVHAQNPLSIYYDDFSFNLGWTMVSPDWQIGPAAASTGHIYGNADPASDADGVLGGGVAGVMIGGNAPIAINGRQYMESPVLSTAGFPGLILAFDRFLNSDYLPYMDNGIDVFDETTMTWVTIWTSGNFPSIQDAGWTHVSYDVSPYVSNSFQVRFWYEVGSGGVFTVSSWNIDNVDFYLAIPGNGQPSTPGVATLDINGSATNQLGNVVSTGQNGIYFATVQTGTQMTIHAEGSPGQPWVLLGGAPNEAATSIAPFGQLDVGTANFGGIEVIGSGLDAGFLNAAFHCNAAGTSTIVFGIPPSFAGVTYGLQGVMVNPTLVIVPTNAVAISFN